MNNKAYIVILLFVGWSLFSWHWYTCWIKGFCSVEKAPTAQSLDAAIDTVIAPVTKVKTVPVAIDRVADCTTYLTGYIRRGHDNEAVNVERLEKFLNAYEGESLLVNGRYENDDEEAVNRFQEKCRSAVLTPWDLVEPTGYVYTKTREHINKLYCERVQQ